MKFSGDTRALSGASALPLLSFKAFLSSFSHPVDPIEHKGGKSEKSSPTVREYHTVEAAETDYQHRHSAERVS